MDDRSTVVISPIVDEAELGGDPAEEEKELLCPICMQIIKDAFLTSCGHSFCYMCIVTHLHNKSDCPCCALSLTPSQLFPNFLLDKGYQVSVKELDSLLSLLAEKKRKLEQEEAERNMQILLDFLHCLKKQKVNELNEVRSNLEYVKDDLNAVERHRLELYQARERCSVKLKVLTDDPPILRSRTSWSTDRNISGPVCNSYNIKRGTTPVNFKYKKNEGKSPAKTPANQSKEASLSEPTSQDIGQSSLAVMRKKRIHAQFNELQEFYLEKRRQLANHLKKQEKKDITVISREGYSSGLDDFQSVLSKFTRYSRLRVIAELRHEDLFHSPNIISSIEFDRDDELFATAGVSRRIKVFDFSSVVNEPIDEHRPVVEMKSRSKLSCLSWNKFTKNHIACSDHDGIVTVWDVITRESIMEYEEHEKCAWSVDFSPTEPSMLVSGSDDCKVKIWSTKQEGSALNIDMKTNICSVKYNPESSKFVAVGSADNHIHYYDLRNHRQPLCVLSGHKRAVSYVKFLSGNELASASTDSTLRLWDLKENMLVRTLRGHTNEKNFVGLTVNDDFLACGSETNEVYVYHKAITKPAMWHRFGSPASEDVELDTGSYFISAVCWKSGSPTMLAANSKGTIKVLVLA